MNEFKGTPGPWSVKVRKSAFDPTVTIEDGVCGADGEQIRVYGLTLAASKEAKANSHLVAAAPELIEALSGMLNVWRTVCSANGWEPEHVSQYDAALAAVAKATKTAP